MTFQPAAWPGIERLTSLELDALETAAGMIGTPPDCLAAVISFETGGTFDPQARNPASGALGLIQFTGPALRMLGLTVEELEAMSFIEQLDPVIRYYNAIRVEAFPTCELLYVATLAPAMLTDPSVRFERGTPAYDQNAGLDFNRDGIIERADVEEFFRGYVAKHSDVAPVGPPFKTEPPPTKTASKERKNSKGDTVFWTVFWGIFVASLVRRAAA